MWYYIFFISWSTYLDHILLFSPLLLDHPHIATHTTSCSLPLPVVQKQKLEQTKPNKTKNTKIKHQISRTSWSVESILTWTTITRHGSCPGVLLIHSVTGICMGPVLENCWPTQWQEYASKQKRCFPLPSGFFVWSGTSCSLLFYAEVLTGMTLHRFYSCWHRLCELIHV